MKINDLFLAAGVFSVSLGAGLLLRSQYEREQLSVERTKILSDKIKKNRRLVFLSDLHDHEFGPKNERLLAAIDEVKPDAVLIGGDMMVTRENVDLTVSLDLIGELVKRCPVYYGNGNHETRMNWNRKTYGDLYDSYSKKLKQMGVVFLSNENRLFGDDISIAGIDLAGRYYTKFHPARLYPEAIKRLAGPADRDVFQILLCHSPLFFDSCRKWGADLTLSGHFHGGTIRIPYLGGVMTPQFQFFLPWCAGTFEENGKYMIVSRGLGTHSVNIRLNNKPQVVVVDLLRPV